MYSTSLKKLLSLLTVFAMVFSIIAVVQPMQASAATVEIPIANGDFENGAFGGAVAGSNGASIVEKATYEGNYALKFDATGEILTVTGYLPAATTAESTVTLSFMAKVLAGSTQNSVNFGLFATNESWGNRVQKYGAGYPIVGGDWKQISQALTVPAGTKIIQAQIYLGAAGAIAIIDNVSITDASGNEILQSGGFEKGVLNGDFNANAALEIVKTPVHGGAYAAHADKSAGNGNISTTVTFDPSTKDRTMHFSFWMYAPTSVNSVHTMVVCFDTSSGAWTNLSTKYGAQYATPGTWVQKTMEIAVPANTNTLQVQLYAQDAGADFYIDDLKLTAEVADIVNHNVSLGLNQVTGDGTWQFSISEAPANKYYKVPAVIDGVACNFLMGESGGIMCVYPNFYTALGGIVPTETIVIAEGTVLKAVDPNNSWNEIEGADTYTIREKIDLSYANGAWSKTVYTEDVELSFSQVTGDSTWQLSISNTPANKYYKLPVIVDGSACEILVGESGGMICIYPNFFTALGGAVPTKSFVVEKNAVMVPMESNNGWKEIEGATHLVVTNGMDMSFVDGAWGITVPNMDVSMGFNQVTGDGTWQLSISNVPEEKYYKLPVTIDGIPCFVVVGLAGDIVVIYPSFFGIMDGFVPAESLTIEAGAVMKAVDSTNGWKVIADAATVTVTNSLTIENVLGVWKDMSQYADMTFQQLYAKDLNVYRAEDQAASQYRSVFAISSIVPLGNAGWGTFTKVAAKVLVDGVETNAIFGMVPADDEGWGNESAFLLYITGEGYWDAASTASCITICKGTKILPSDDAASGFEFAEDFVIYRNCDGTWDTTADTHIYNVQNVEAEGALVSAANCQSAAIYKYSCCCGQLGTETFTYGKIGDHNYVDGVCGFCGDVIKIQNITVSLQTITGDGTWQLIPSAAPANTYYKVTAIIDGIPQNILVQYASNLLLIYPNFFTAFGSSIPQSSFVLPAGTTMKAADPNGWVDIEGAEAVVLSTELKIENIAGKWVEMSKYAGVSFTEIHAADLDVYYHSILRLGDYSDAQLKMALMAHPEYQELVDIYGRDGNMTTIGIKSILPTLRIPNDANWSNFQLLGTITVNGANPWETYVLQTRDSSYTDSETAMDSAFLLRFYNGFVGDQAISITIEPGTMIVTKDGSMGFVFVDGYTIYRDENGAWSDVAPTAGNPVDKWGLTLGDNIGVSFEMNVADSDTVTFTVNGNAVTAVKNGNTYTIYLAAAQMTDEIVISVNDVETGKAYSIRRYADIILSGSYTDQTKALVKAMLTYGGAAQNYFGYNTGALANEGIDVTVSAPSGESAVAMEGSVSGINFYGATLIHRNKTAVRFYFVANSIEGLSFTINGAACETGMKNGMYYVEIADINPQDLGADVTVVVSNGTDALSVAYSPMDYMIRMYEKETSSDATKALVQALYGYYLAATDYLA